MRAAAGAVDEVAVVVPARDEEQHLAGCLDALRVAAAGVDVPVRVVLVLDRCRDSSVRIARSRRDVLVIEADLGGVGAARALGVSVAARVAAVTSGRLWLAGTDADTVVPRDWLARQVALAGQGWDVVLGTVDMPATGPVERAWRAAYRSVIGADGAHPHVHGANLGVRADVCSAAGGWPPLGAGEDRALVAAVRAAGARVLATDAVRVMTSSRRHGRALGGVACDLRRLASSLPDAARAEAGPTSLDSDTAA